MTAPSVRRLLLMLPASFKRTPARHSHTWESLAWHRRVAFLKGSERMPGSNKTRPCCPWCTYYPQMRVSPASEVVVLNRSLTADVGSVPSAPVSETRSDPARSTRFCEECRHAMRGGARPTTRPGRDRFASAHQRSSPHAKTSVIFVIVFVLRLFCGFDFLLALHSLKFDQSARGSRQYPVCVKPTMQPARTNDSG